MSLSKGFSQNQMADLVIKFFKSDCSVNLGIGLPTLIAERIPADKNILIHSENGVLGISGRPTADTVSPTLINAGKETVAIKPGASFFDSAMSFGMIRGGHIDFCILGGMQVDAEGSLANWMIPGKKVTGMGGAMDLVNGAKHVIVMLTHFDPKGFSKLVKKCDLPLTGFAVVNTVVTDLAVFSVVGGKFKILNLAPGISVADLQMGKDILDESLIYQSTQDSVHTGL